MIQSSWALLFIEPHNYGGLCSQQPTCGQIELHHADRMAKRESVGNVSQQSCVPRNFSTWMTVESFVALAAAVGLQPHQAE